MLKKEKKPDNYIKIGIKSKNKSIISLCQKYLKEKIFTEIHFSAVGSSIEHLVTIVEVLKILVPDLYQQNHISTVTYQSIEEGSELKEPLNQKLLPKFDVTLSFEKPKTENEGFQNKLSDDERKKILEIQSKIKEDKKNKKKGIKSFNKKKKIIHRRENSVFHRRRVNRKFGDKKFETTKRTSFRKRFKSVSNKFEKGNNEEKKLKKNYFKKSSRTNSKKEDGDKKFNGLKRKSFSKSFRNYSKKENDKNKKYNEGARRKLFNKYEKNQKFSGANNFKGRNRNMVHNNSIQKIKN